MGDLEQPRGETKASPEGGHPTVNNDLRKTGKAEVAILDRSRGDIERSP